jgi:hypothetical protein
MDEERRLKIVHEIEDRLGIEEVPAHAMTRRELKKMLGIGDVALDRALDEVNAEGRLNKAWTYKRNINGRPYKVEVL